MTVNIKHNDQSFEIAKSGMLCLPFPMATLPIFESILESKSNKAWNASVAVVQEKLTAQTRTKVGNYVLRFTVDNTAHAKRIASAFRSYAKKAEDKKLVNVFTKRADKIDAWIAYVS